MDELIKHVSNIYAMDRATLAVIAALCAAAAFTIKDYLANPFMALFIFPVLFFFSAIAKYLILLCEIYPPSKLDQWLMWTISAAIAGNMIGIAVVASLGRLSEALRPEHPLARKSAERARNAS